MVLIKITQIKNLTKAKRQHQVFLDLLALKGKNHFTIKCGTKNIKGLLIKLKKIIKITILKN